MSNKRTERIIKKIEDCKNMQNRQNCSHCLEVIQIVSELNALTERLLLSIAYPCEKPNEKTLYCSMITKKEADLLLIGLRNDHK